jgi:hypothetical protein
MARKTIIGELKEFVEEQTKGVGVVSNLHGIIETSDDSPAEVKSQQWFAAAVSSATPPDMQSILRLFTYEKPGFDPIQGDATGLAQYPASGAAIPPNTAVLFYGAISLPNSRKFDIRLRGEGSTVALYLDGVQFASGTDTVRSSPEVSAGYHILTGIVHGSIKPVFIEVSTDLEVVRSELNPTAPAWLKFPKAYAIEPLSGTVNATMQWSNDSHASEWNVYRAPTTLLGLVTGTPTLTADNNISFQVPGPVTLVEGDIIFSEYFEAGVVVSVASGTPSTIVVTPVLETDSVLSNWTGIRTYSVNAFVPIATIPNAGGDAVQFDDDKLAKNAFYVYKVTSVGPFGLSESNYSTALGLFANDEDCPAGINWDGANQPTIVIEGYQATVRFPAPSDPDFAGVRVYGPYALVGGVLIPPSAFDPTKAIVTQNSSPNKREQVLFRVDESTLNQGYFLATFDAQGNQQPPVAFTSRRTGNLQTAAYGFIYAGPTDPTIECYARITASTANTVTVTATGRGTGVQVQYVGVTGGATYQSGTAAGTPVTPNGTNNVWVFNRAVINGGAGQAQFRATRSGFQSDDDFATIEEQGRDTIPLILRAEVIATTAVNLTVRVRAANPITPNTNITLNYLTLAVGTVSPSTGQVISTGVTTDIETTNFVDFTVPRPLIGQGTGRIVFTGTMTGRTSDSDAVDVPQIDAAISGTQILSNPFFFGGLTNYSVYDNLSSGRVTHALITDALAPNPSGQLLRITTSAGSTPGTLVSPGLGGFFVGIPEDGGVYKPDTYHKNTPIQFIIKAKIPVGYQIIFASNSIGSDGTIIAQTLLLGTGSFVEYRWLVTTGTTGSFSTTGFWYITPNGAYDGLAVSWDVASVTPFDRNRAAVATVLPTLVLTSNELGSSAAVAATVVDPQNRVRGSGSGIRFTTISGRGSSPPVSTSAAGVTAVGSVISPGGNWSTTNSPGDVVLLPKLSSFVEVDLYGIDADGRPGVLLDHRRLSFGLGTTPLPPDIGYTADGVGNVNVTATVDNDTASVRVVVSKISMPTASQVAAASPFSVATASSLVNFGNLLTGLNSGDRYYIAMQSYNSTEIPSDLVSLTDVYIAGGGNSIAQVSWTATIASASNITYRIKPNRHCAEFEVYVKEYSSDPGADAAVDGSYPTPFDAIVVGVNTDPSNPRYRAQPELDYDLSVPISGGTNYVMLTIVPYDTLARQGPRLNKKAQGNGTAAPLPPTSSAIVGSPAQTSVQLSIVPATPRPDRVKMYRDNVFISTIDVSASTAGVSFNLPNPTDTGLTPSTTYVYSFSGYDSTSGIESAGRSPALSVTTAAPSGGSGQIPTPTLASASYNPATETWSWSVTPGANTPSGVTWHVERATTSGGTYTEHASNTSTSLSESDPMDTTGGTDYYFKCWGTLTSWTDSSRSTFVGPIHKTGTSEPTQIPTIGLVTNPSSHTVRIAWTNTNTTDKIYIALERLNGSTWEAASEVGNIAAGTTTFDRGVITIGMYYRARVRYYNAARNGTFSAYGQTAGPIT